MKSVTAEVHDLKAKMAEFEKKLNLQVKKNFMRKKTPRKKLVAEIKKSKR